jgi:hypothetical protein
LRPIHDDYRRLSICIENEVEFDEVEFDEAEFDEAPRMVGVSLMRVCTKIPLSSEVTTITGRNVLWNSPLAISTRAFRIPSMLCA